MIQFNTAANRSTKSDALIFFGSQRSKKKLNINKNNNDSLILSTASSSSIKLDPAKEKKLQELITNGKFKNIEKFFNTLSDADKQNFAQRIQIPVGDMETGNTRSASPVTVCISYLKNAQVKNEAKNALDVLKLLLKRNANVRETFADLPGYSALSFLAEVLTEKENSFQQKWFDSSFQEAAEQIIGKIPVSERMPLVFKPVKYERTSSQKRSPLEQALYSENTLLINVFQKYDNEKKIEAYFKDNLKKYFDLIFSSVLGKDLKECAKTSPFCPSFEFSNDYGGSPIEVLVYGLENEEPLNRCDLKSVKTALRNHYLGEFSKRQLNPNVHSNGIPPVVMAAQKGDLGTVKALVEYGADVTLCANENIESDYYSEDVKSACKGVNALQAVKNMLQTLPPKDPRLPEYNKLEKYLTKITGKAQTNKEKLIQERDGKVRSAIRLVLNHQHEKRIRGQNAILALNWQVMTPKFLRMRLLNVAKNWYVTKNWFQENPFFRLKLAPKAILSKEQVETEARKEAIKEQLKPFKNQETDSKVQKYIRDFENRLNVIMKYKNFSTNFEQLKLLLKLKNDFKVTENLATIHVEGKSQTINVKEELATIIVNLDKIKSPKVREDLTAIIQALSKKGKNTQALLLFLLKNAIGLEINSLYAGTDKLYAGTHKEIKDIIGNFTKNVQTGKSNDITQSLIKFKNDCLVQNKKYLNLVKRDAETISDKKLKNEINQLISSLPEKILDPGLDLPNVVTDLSERLKKAKDPARQNQ